MSSFCHLKLIRIQLYKKDKKNLPFIHLVLFDPEKRAKIPSGRMKSISQNPLVLITSGSFLYNQLLYLNSI